MHRRLLSSLLKEYRARSANRKRTVAVPALLLLCVVPLTGCGSAAAPQIPYAIDKRPMPAGEALDVLVPRRVGSFTREAFAPGTRPSSDEDLNATYTSGTAQVTLGFSILEDTAGAREAILTTREEAIASEVNIKGEQFSVDTEPSYFKVSDFMSWSRGSYFYYVHASDPQALDSFLQAFTF